MKKSSILFLKKLNKIVKNQARRDYAGKINELNEATDFLKSAMKKLQEEFSCQNGADEKLMMINYSSGWKNISIEKISTQQSKIQSISLSAESFRVSLEEITKRSILYEKLSQS